MSLPIEPEKLGLEFDLEPTASGFSRVAFAVESSFWVAAVLNDPVLLFLEDVVRSLSDLERDVEYAVWSGESDSRELFRKATALRRDSFWHVDDVLSFLGASKLQRPRYMDDFSWEVTKDVIQLLELLAQALHSEDGLLLQQVFFPGSAGVGKSSLNWPAGISLTRAAQFVLMRTRADIDPRVVDMRAGSIIATVVGVGGPLIVPIIGVLTVRSIIRKNNSDVIKARADAAKSGAEALLADSQRIKVIAETEKVRAETAELHLNLIKGVVDQRDDLTPEARDAIVEIILRLESRENPGISWPFAATAKAVVDENVESLAFLAQRIRVIERG
ncbi:hypothetical protein ACIBP4_02535 [Micromonospora maritima]|uniref:Uncharacterized protein n=1 Tax=Micromonospora maritima TaxID=986711 RepID=A0ABW7ZE87_9ACTN